MKNNQWNPQAKDSDANVATMPAPVPIKNDAAFDKLRYQPTPRVVTAPTQVARTVSPPAGPNATIQAVNDAVRDTSTWVRPLQQEMGRVIVGQKQSGGSPADCAGHQRPRSARRRAGLAKTLSLKTLAGAVSLHFKRLQFTPDMLPADIVGTMIYNPQDGEFRTKHGPIFANLILADEINRAPAKVQSALLEAMQERQVTLGDSTYELPDPFFVLATQNPLEQEGTYPLPEAQVDRFMMKVIIGYPNRVEERAILDSMATSEPRSACSRLFPARKSFAPAAWSTPSMWTTRSGITS